MIAVLAAVYAMIVGPLITTLEPAVKLQAALPRLDTRLVWPVLAASAVGVAIRHRARFTGPWPPHLVALYLYLGYAGASILWSCEPKVSFTRLTQQVLVIGTLVVAVLAAERSTLSRIFLWCCAPAAVLNLAYLPLDLPAAVKLSGGYMGYFNGKNYLGEFAGITILLALGEMRGRGPPWRRMLGAVIAALCGFLIVVSDCKTTLGFVVLAPLAAELTLRLRRWTGLSPALILLAVPVGYFLLSSVSNFNIYRLSNIAFGDPDLTNRTIIWAYADMMIARQPLLGWGYQAFWLSGLDAPSVGAPGWVAAMPEGHNGFVDARLELGYVGLAFLLVFLFSTLHGIGRVADRNPRRAWLLLSLALYITCHNVLESLWMRGFEFQWVTFLLVAAETGRYWWPLTSRVAAARHLPRRPNSGARALGSSGLRLSR